MRHTTSQPSGRHLRVLVLMLLAVLLTPERARAVAAAPDAISYDDQEGTTVALVTHGDEFFKYETTPDGMVVQTDPETGAASYVVWEDGTLALGEPVAGDDAPDDACSAQDLTTDELRRAYKELGGVDWEPVEEPVFELVEPEQVAGPDELASAGLLAGPLQAPSAAQAERTLPLLAIVVGFANTPYATTYDWGATLFGEGDTLSQYYLDMSGGAFTFVPAVDDYEDPAASDRAGDGVVHVTLDDFDHGNWYELANWKNVSDKQGKSEKNYNEYMLRALSAAVAQADAHVDFSAYDTNGDGTISTNELAICFVVAGYEGAVLGGSAAGVNAPIMWAHAWKLSAREKGNAPTVDGVTVDEYIAVSEQLTTTPTTPTNASQEPGSVLYHELGHYLGLPDLYPTGTQGGAWSTYEVGHLSLMAMGEWNRTSAGTYVPGALDAWSRYQLGWIDPVEVDIADLTEEGEVHALTSQLADEGYEALLLRVGDTEYFLIENRQAEGYDAGDANHYRTAPSGVVIWHVDTSVYDAHKKGNTVNDANHRPAVMPVFAEYDADGILVLASAGGKPKTGQALWSSTLWEQVAKDRSDRLYLSAYQGQDAPSARTYAGAWIQFLSTPGRAMQVRIGASDANPFDETDPDDGPEEGGSTTPDDPTDPTDEDDEWEDDADDEEDDADDEEDDADDEEDDEDDNEDDDLDGWDDSEDLGDGEVVALGMTSDRPRPTVPGRSAPARASRSLPGTGDEPLPVLPLALAGVAALGSGVMLRRRR